MEVKRDILWRVYLCFLGMVLLCICVLGRAVYISQVQGKYWRGMSDSLHQKYVAMDAERGTIYSEDGDMLSTSIPYFNIYIDFGADGLREKNGKRFFDNVDSLSWCLSKLFGDASAAAYKRELERGYHKRERYYPFKKEISFETYKALRHFPLVRQGRNKSGFIVEEESKRLNPFGLLANRTIGLARENAQNVGLERTYDGLLRGVSGKRLVRYIAGGAYMPVEGYEIDPENGKDIITTLNVNIQDIAENALLKMMIANECEHGTCIVMEVSTGKIKAIANLGRQPDGSYWEDMNYAIMRSEPGSTFKLATLLSLLEDKDVTLTQHVNLEDGKWKVAHRTVYDAESHEGKSDVTVEQAFALSSNVGMAKLVWTHYSKNPYQFVNHLRKLHLDDYSGINIAGESRPVIKTPRSKTWSATTLPWMAFGYEVLINPVQTLTLYNAVANDGKMMKPYLVDAIQESGRTVQSFGPEVADEKICSDQTLKELKECLEDVMTEGTGKDLRTPYYRIAGKTGTALVANGKRGYADHIYQSSFVGYFPADHPQYTCIVVIKNKPHAKIYYGAKVAGPVFREVADKLYALSATKNYLTAGGMHKVPEPDSTKYCYAGYVPGMKKVMNVLQLPYTDSAGKQDWGHLYPGPGGREAVLNREPVSQRSMPDVKGMGMEDALYLLENMDLGVSVKGEGKVRAQTPEPGTALRKHQTVTLELN